MWCSFSSGPKWQKVQVQMSHQVDLGLGYVPIFNILVPRPAFSPIFRGTLLNHDFHAFFQVLSRIPSYKPEGQESPWHFKKYCVPWVKKKNPNPRWLYSFYCFMIMMSRYLIIRSQNNEYNMKFHIILFCGQIVVCSCYEHNIIKY